MPNKQGNKISHKDKNRAEGEIGDLRESLNDAYSQFNNTTDTDALDACIFEINALRSRYNTALKHYRERYF